MILNNVETIKGNQQDFYLFTFTTTHPNSWLDCLDFMQAAILDITPESIAYQETSYFGSPEKTISQSEVAENLLFHKIPAFHYERGALILVGTSNYLDVPIKIAIHSRHNIVKAYFPKNQVNENLSKNDFFEIKRFLNMIQGSAGSRVALRGAICTCEKYKSDGTKLFCNERERKPVEAWCEYHGINLNVASAPYEQNF
jgi:hypothetical protein